MKLGITFFLFNPFNHVQLDKSEIFIIIPVYNEQVIVKQVVDSLLDNGYQNIIIIDDGSTEDIFSLLQQKPLIYIRHFINLGQGAALQTGFDFVKKLNPKVVITFDADGQHDAKEISSIVFPILNDEADIVLGSRFLHQSTSVMPAQKKALLQLARYINFLFSGLMLTDAHNGFRALSKKAVNQIRITENRMAHASEILNEIKRHHLRFVEMPVTIHYTNYSKKKGQSILNAVNIFFHLLFNKIGS